MCNFKVGQKVVCIDAVHELIKNEIYTIKSIKKCSCSSVFVETELKLMNYIGTKCHFGHIHEYFRLFYAYRFRPLDHAWNIGAVNVWINYLISNGSYPVLNIIEGCCKNTSNYFEAFWIRYFSCLNKDLLNYCHNTNKDKKLSKWFPVRII